MIFLAVVYVVYEITSSMNAAMQPYVLFLLICVPFMVISLVLLMTKVKETKDVDLEKITAETFR